MGGQRVLTALIKVRSRPDRKLKRERARGREKETERSSMITESTYFLSK